MRINLCLVLFSFFIATSCTNSGTQGRTPCDSNGAKNRMLAIKKVQARLVAQGSESEQKLARLLGVASGEIIKLLEQEKLLEACKMADKVAAKYKLDLEKEQKGMVTAESLAKDGGKASGHCSVADASNRQLEVTNLLQADLEAGRMTQEQFGEFYSELGGLGLLLSTDPSGACDLLDQLKAKYHS